jgi:polyisoprenoid-binding protein YceI
MKRVAYSLLLAAMFVAGCSGGDSTDSAMPNAGSADGALGIPSGTYAVDPTHSAVTFSYLHQDLSYPLLRATIVDGELELDVNAMENSRADIAIRADSIRTNTSYFDEELASPKFFNAGKYPHITFTTERYEPISDLLGKLQGQVTIRGITKPLTLDVTINGAKEHPMSGKAVIGVSASGYVNRSDFDLDRFIPVVADRVEIAIEAEFTAGSSDSSRAAAAIASAAVAGSD